MLDVVIRHSSKVWLKFSPQQPRGFGLELPFFDLRRAKDGKPLIQNTIHLILKCSSVRISAKDELTVSDSPFLLPQLHLSAKNVLATTLACSSIKRIPYRNPGIHQVGRVDTDQTGTKSHPKLRIIAILMFV